MFVEGKLKRHEIPAVLAHLDGCVRCMRAVRGASADLERPASKSPWLAIAAAVAITIAIAVMFQLRSASVDDLVKLSPRSARVLEPRLSGGFAWAPWRGPMRSSGETNDSQRMKLVGVAGELVEHADRTPSANAQHAAGLALVSIGASSDAVERLRDAATRAPDDARAWSDLAAAQYAAASSLARPSMLPEALASADRALRIDPKLAEALFNRALILERLGLSQQAREAWQRYLDVDPSSPWANEARERLAKLPATTSESQFRKDLPLLERAASNGDQRRVEQIVAQYRQQSRAFGEAEHLGLWAEAHLRGEAAEAARLLGIARAIGNALARLGGESLLHDAVATIDRADAQRTRLLANAHAAYRRGRMTYARQQPSVAEPELRRAASLFADAKSPMALVARYFAASARYDRNEVDGAERDLESLLAHLDARYLALGAQVRWQLSLCRMLQNDWSGALPLVSDAVDAFRRIDERSNLAFLQTLLADTLVSLSRPDEAWAVRIESFRMQSAEGRADRVPVSLDSAARMELRAGRLDAARAFLGLEESAHRAIGNDVLLTSALAREAVMSTVLGDRQAAAAYVDEAERVAQRIGDSALRSRAMTDVDFARGAVLLDAASLTRAIAGYEQVEKPIFLPECHLLRARALLKTGERERAAEDLERGIAHLERHRVAYAGAMVGTGILDAGRALFRDAIALAMQRGDIASAFAYAERSRAHVGTVPASAKEIQHRLRGSDAAVLEIVVLDDEVVTFCVTADGIAVGRASYDESARDPARLYDATVRGVERAIANVHHLIFVPDPALDGVSFGALYDSVSRTHLIERAAVSVALSASSLQLAPNTKPSSVLAIALPSGESAGTVGLPQIARELTDVRALYARSIGAADHATFAELATSAANADVVHIAGHTQQRAGAAGTGLRFGDHEWASWRNVAASRFDEKATIVLAACETLRRPQYGRGFELSLGGGFLAAGAGNVIGTLDVIADDDAYEIFRSVHRQLAAGTDAAEAVRRTQIEALASHRTTAWQSIAVLTRTIPSREK